MRTIRVVLGLSLALSACRGVEPPTGGDFKDVPADMVMIGMTQYMTAEGLRRAKLVGDTAYVFDDSGKVAVKGVNLEIYNETGAPTATLTSRAGDFNTTTQAMVARGKVILITTTGNRRIETEELFYEPQTHRLWSNVNTLLIEGSSRTAASGFTSDDKFTNFEMKTKSIKGLKVKF